MRLENGQFFDLTKGENREIIKDFFDSIGIQQQTIEYAFDYYGLNRKTLESLIDRQGYRPDKFEEYLQDNRPDYEPLDDNEEKNENTEK